jgi:hypothetical protein
VINICHFFQDMARGAMVSFVQKHVCDRAHCNEEFCTEEEIRAHVEAHLPRGVRSVAVRVETSS